MHLDLHFQFKLSCFENDCAEPYFFQSFLKIYLKTRGKNRCLHFCGLLKTGFFLFFLVL